MVDFLRANPWCSQEEYKWGMSVPQVRLASMDFSHVEYLTEREKKLAKHKPKGRNLIGSAPSMASDLGIPIFTAEQIGKETNEQ